MKEITVMQSNPKLYPISHGRTMTESNVVSMYKYCNKKQLRCRLPESMGYQCPEPVDGISCYYCIAAPFNYPTVLKKHNINKLKGISL